MDRLKVNKTMNKAYKYRLYPTEEQAEQFKKTFGCVRFIYNRMLTDKIEHYKTTGEPVLTVTPAKYKKEYGFLREVDSLALANAQRHLETAYKRYFGGAGFPRFKKRNERESYTTNSVNGNIRVGERHIRLPKTGEVRLKKHREIPEGYAVKSATVSRDVTGKYHVSVLCEYEKLAEAAEVKKRVELSATEEPAELSASRRRSEAELKKLKRELGRMEKGSANWVKQQRRLAEARVRAADRRSDALHKETKRLAEEYDLVEVRESEGEPTAESWGMFVGLLKYKLEDRGKYLVKPDKEDKQESP